MDVLRPQQKPAARPRQRPAAPEPPAALARPVACPSAAPVPIRLLLLLAGAQGENQLAALRQMSKVVADTGEIEAMRAYRPIDATTNPRCSTGRLLGRAWTAVLRQWVPEPAGLHRRGAVAALNPQAN